MNCQKTLIIIKGAGDIATGVAHRLHRCGYGLLLLDLEKPTAIRRTVAFCQAMYDGQITIEGVTAERADHDNFRGIMENGRIPVMTVREQLSLNPAEQFEHHHSCGGVSPLRGAGAAPDWLDTLNPSAFIEATLSKKNTGLSRKEGRVTLALGPGYEAGRDADAVVETARGHFLGRLILEGPAKANTGKPGLIGGYDLERLIRSPAAGEVYFDATIGQSVKAGEILGRVDGQPIVAAIDGVLRGALQNGLSVPPNFKIGDIDPRPEAAGFIHTPSDKARAVAGGVLEGLLHFGVKP